MPFPAPGVSVPTLSTYQWSYQGYTFGAGTPLQLKQIEGFDMPAVRNGDAGRPRDPGRFIGLDALDGRDLTLTGELLTATNTAWSNVATATVPGGTTEFPLYFASPFWGTLVTMARVRKRQMPINIAAAAGLVGTVIQFASSDPRWYTTPTQNPSVSPPGTTAGFAFPLSFPLSFGGGGVAGSLSITNAGNIEMRPILVITGPCTNPSVTNATAAGSPVLQFNLTMNSGDQLVIDTDMHTATFFTSGSTIGSTRLYTQARGNQWWTLAPGANTIQFLTGDPTATGTLTVQWASSYIL